MAHELQINNNTFYVHGNDTKTLKEICETLDLKYSKLRWCKLSESQSIIKVWKIGELSDYLKTQLA